MAQGVFRVRQPGLMTTVQDLGRAGHRAAGVSPGGAVDPFALAAANLLCGNDEGAAALEVTLRGPRLEVLADAVVAVTGADLGATVDGFPVAPWTAVGVRRGWSIAFGARKAGVRAYLAVAGGIAAPAFLGSRSADVRCGLGPKPLRAGDILAAGPPRRRPPKSGAAAGVRAAAVYSELTVLRVMPGPDLEWFPAGAFDALLAGSWRIRPASDRSGVRLGGGRVPRRDGEMPAEPVAFGHVQVPPDGEPIILGPECHSVGGYPRIACVVSADRPRLAQLGPGDPVKFAAVTVDEARWLTAAQRGLLDTIRG